MTLTTNPPQPSSVARRRLVAGDVHIHQASKSPINLMLDLVVGLAGVPQFNRRRGASNGRF